MAFDSGFVILFPREDGMEAAGLFSRWMQISVGYIWKRVNRLKKLFQSLS